MSIRGHLQVLKTRVFLCSIKRLKKKLDDLNDEYKKKQALLQQLQSEFTQNQQQSQYLEKAEMTTTDIQNKFNSNATLQRQKSFNHFNVTPMNPTRNFMPFMSLRVHVTSNSLSELNEKMTELIQKLRETNLKCDREELDNESLKFVKHDLKRQRQFDHIKLKQLMPSVQDMGQVVGTLELAKFINQTRVNTATSGIYKCRGDMSFFKNNKDDRLIEKRIELQDQEVETKNLKVVMQQKQQQLEQAKKKLTLLKKQNDSIKIDEIIQKFFVKRNTEEDLLNKLEMIYQLQLFMNERKQSNDFAFESDLKTIFSYLKLLEKLDQELGFSKKLQPQQQNYNSSSIVEKQYQSLNQSQKSIIMIDNLTLKEREKKGEYQTLQIQVRWEDIKHKLLIREKFIISQYEEVMIKNQLLNVSFDEQCAEKNNKKLLRENLLEQLQKLNEEVKTSQKLMSEENQSSQSITHLRYLYENYKKIFEYKNKIHQANNFRQKIFQFLADVMIKVSAKLDKMQQTIPQMNFDILNMKVQKYLPSETLEMNSPQTNNNLLSVTKKNSNQNGSRRGSLLKPSMYSESTFEFAAELQSSSTLKAIPDRQNSMRRMSRQNSLLTPKNWQKQRKATISKFMMITLNQEKEQQQENKLFEKIQTAIRLHLNVMLNIDYIKTLIRGLKDMTEVQVQWINNKDQDSDETLQIQYERDINYKDFKREYTKCQSIFQLYPKESNIPDTKNTVQSKDESTGNSNAVNAGIFLEPRSKNRKSEVDECKIENSFLHLQYKKLKEDKIKKQKEIEQLKLRQEKERIKLQLNASINASAYIPKPLTSKSALSSQQQIDFKEINKKLVDFQKNESRFINKFVKECDNVSLKINRFTSGVLPPQEKVNLSQIQLQKPSRAMSKQEPQQEHVEKLAFQFHTQSSNHSPVKKSRSSISVDDEIQFNNRLKLDDKIKEIRIHTNLHLDKVNLMSDDQEKRKLDSLSSSTSQRQSTSRSKITLTQGDIHKSTKNSKKISTIQKSKFNMWSIQQQSKINSPPKIKEIVQQTSSQQNKFFRTRLTSQSRERTSSSRVDDPSIKLLQDELRSKTPANNIRLRNQMNQKSLPQFNTYNIEEYNKNINNFFIISNDKFRQKLINTAEFTGFSNSQNNIFDSSQQTQDKSDIYKNRSIFNLNKTKSQQELLKAIQSRANMRNQKNNTQSVINLINYDSIMKEMNKSKGSKADILKNLYKTEEL
ncbi:UNKNOWN [Stylonychia lemnae]|uniref:Uncharacterized protein n=1 Tax=Stylonychia lemnae TaxID=5949 RepID=A0A078AMH9_STYLE|nr:UNKNOWN [Stylonychia lemnae]|eukprot:CDW82597.1 UNKNOWN [Stylonychia lemnae]